MCAVFQLAAVECAAIRASVRGLCGLLVKSGQPVALAYSFISEHWPLFSGTKSKTRLLTPRCVFLISEEITQVLISPRGAHRRCVADFEFADIWIFLSLDDGTGGHRSGVRPGYSPETQEYWH